MKKLMKMLLIILVMFMGCRRVDEDLSQDPVYKHMVGKEYRTKMELVVWGKKKDLTISRALWGGEVPREKAPFKYQGEKVWGFLPVGSEFKIVKIKYEGSTGMSFKR